MKFRQTELPSMAAAKAKASINAATAYRFEHDHRLPSDHQQIRGRRRPDFERRQPLETTAALGAGAFEERVVEVRETAEEPVVAKTAHVVEEVVVGREARERTETVKDTVRREEIEVSKHGEVKR